MSVETDNKSGISKIGFCAAFEQGYDILTFVLGQQTNNSLLSHVVKMITNIIKKSLIYVVDS